MASCKLIIEDEVNIKLEGLDVDIRRKLSNALKFEIPYARYMPQYKLGRWDGKVAFFGIGGTGYVNHLDTIVEVLTKNNVQIVDIEDNRHPVQLDFQPITERYWADQDVRWPKGHPAEGELIMLRDYQVDAINNFAKNPQSLQQIATGAGKTITTATLSHMGEKYGRSLVIVPNKSLVVQTEEDYRNCGLDVGVYFGDRKELNHTHTICTWQSLNVLDKKSYDSDTLTLAEFTEGVSAIIIDEVHQAKADVLKKLLTVNFRNAPIRWGLTGTIPKEEWQYQSLLASIGPVTNRVSAYDLQQKDVLAKLEINILQSTDIEQFRNYQEEYTFLVTDERRLDWMGNTIKDLSETGNTLVLVNRIDTGNKLIKNIPSATFIKGDVKLDDRKEQYDEIKTSS